MFRKPFNIISTQVEQILINGNQFNLFYILNYFGLYREGEVIICVTTKFETFSCCGIYVIC
jgi:hypothetical protein